MQDYFKVAEEQRAVRASDGVEEERTRRGDEVHILISRR